MRRLIRGIVYLAGLCALTFVFFFVPIGQRTLWDHAQRIAATEPAQELGQELGAAGERVGDRARSEWEARLQADGGI
ncbi:MAG: hypothetical protein K8H88_34405 [Sandaracinaceae bacterium]|nr:hypothetical protein [Sandaracinaceae bacterium]